MLTLTTTASPYLQIAIGFMVAALLLALAAFVVAVRAFWRPMPATTTDPTPLRREEPDVCDPAWRELEADPGNDDDDDDDGDDEDDIAAKSRNMPGGIAATVEMLIEIDESIFTRAEVEALDALHTRWIAGAA